MTTLDNFAKAEGVAGRLTSINNQFLNLGGNFNPILNRIEGLTAPQKATLDASLTELGVAPSDFDALVVSIRAVLTAINTNLTTISTEI